MMIAECVWTCDAELVRLVVAIATPHDDGDVVNVSLYWEL